MQFTFLPSPNYSQRTSDDISMVVIHHISLPPHQFGGDYITDFFLNQLDIDTHPYFREIADSKVSAHLLIKRSGEVIQFVDFSHKAWHAGRSYYAGMQDLNNCSIGIELEGDEHTAFTDAQYLELDKILEYLIQQYPIKYIVGHSDIAPKRKTDPGTQFSWEQLLHGTIMTQYR